jgi:hypothetical protein
MKHRTAVALTIAALVAFPTYAASSTPTPIKTRPCLTEFKPLVKPTPTPPPSKP